MATDKKITELPAATLPILGSGARVELVQGGVNVQTDPDNIGGGTVPDADATTKGIVEVAAMSEIVAGTDVGGTGASLAVLPSQLGITRTVTGADADVQTDHNGFIIFNSATPFNFTLDQLLAKTKISFINYGAGAVTFVNGSGVTAAGNLVLGGAVGTAYPGALVIYDTLTTPRVITGSGAAVQSVTGVGVDITDPENPIVEIIESLLDEVSVAPVSGTMTLDMDSMYQRTFKDTTVVGTHTIAFANMTNAKVFTLQISVTGGISITMPSSVVMEEADTRWVNATKILTLTGTTASGFQLSFTKFDSVYQLLVSSRFYTS